MEGLWVRGRTIGALRVKRHVLVSANGTLRSACHELRCLRAFLFIVLQSAQYPQPTNTSLFANFRRTLTNAPLPPESFCLALFAQRTRIPTSARSIGFCVIWVCISSSLSSLAVQPYEVESMNKAITET